MMRSGVSLDPDWPTLSCAGRAASMPGRRRPCGGSSAAHALLARDPALLVAALGVWAALSGIALLWPGSAFAAGPSYAALHRLEAYAPEPMWGVVQILDGLALALSAVRGGVLARALAAFASAGCWLPFGLLSLAGGLEYQPTPASPWGIFSGVGCWWVCGGLFLIASGVAWVGHAAPPPPPSASGAGEASEP